MLRSRLVILAAVVPVALVVLVPKSERAPAQAAPVQITSPLPGWVAPGGGLALEGTAPPATLLTLLAGGRALVQTRSRADGTFRLRARAPDAGRHALALQMETERLKLGLLRVRPLVLAAAGDVNLGDRVASAIAAHGPRHPWRSVAPVLRRADLAIANLECAVSTQGARVDGKKYAFRGRPRALAPAAQFAGIDVLSLANNHTLDYGRTAFIDTIRHASRFRIATIGGGSNLAAARRPAVLEAGGLRVAFLAYSDIRPLGFDAGTALAGTAPAFPELVSPDVRRARREADVVVVYFHWGKERAFRPDARQRALAEVALRAGATVVLGAHPHVLQPIERVRGKRLVAWSLGNFVFGATSPGTRRTGILTVRLGARGVLGHRFRPARIGGSHSVQPQLVR